MRWCRAIKPSGGAPCECGHTVRNLKYVLLLSHQSDAAPANQRFDNAVKVERMPAPDIDVEESEFGVVRKALQQVSGDHEPPYCLRRCSINFASSDALIVNTFGK